MYQNSVAEPDLELRVDPGLYVLALLAFLPFVISSFLSKISGGGGGGRVPLLDTPLKFVY